MTRTRTDSWTFKEDEILAKVVLETISKGKTQLEGFEFAGKKLGRTTSACAFRWNSVVRKKFTSELKVAKKERKKMKQKENVSLKKQFTSSMKENVVEINKKEFDVEFSFSEIKSYFGEIENRYQNLERENELFKSELLKLQEDYLELEKEYEFLLNTVTKQNKKRNFLEELESNIQQIQ